MIRTILVTGGVLAAAAAAAMAHQGVTNPAVMARMQLMSAVADETKVLGQMIKRAVPFDGAAASSARTALIGYAGEVAEAFAAQETDPKSQALPAIWDDAAGFADEVAAFVAATHGLDVSSKEALSLSFRDLGKSCGGCHADYRN